jgi:hypothetical protein
MLADNNIPFVEEQHPLGGVHRIYSFPDGHQLSLINGPIFHIYPYAWEIAVLKDDALDYTTLLTEDVIVCRTDDEANAVLAKAKKLFS